MDGKDGLQSRRFCRCLVGDIANGGGVIFLLAKHAKRSLGQWNRGVFLMHDLGLCRFDLDKLFLLRLPPVGIINIQAVVVAGRFAVSQNDPTLFRVGLPCFGRNSAGALN